MTSRTACESEAGPTGAEAPVAPALYDAVVGHERFERIHRRFSHHVYYWLVDLDELPVLPVWLRGFAGFHARDHLGDPARSIRANVASYLANRGVDLAGGRVLMLANARVLGHVFNPISVYWCYRPEGQLRCVVAEVHNTYSERHCYLLEPDAAGRATVDKDFYVSPFLTGDGQYRMRFSAPGESLSVTIVLRQGSRTTFTATLRGQRRPAGTANVLRMLLRLPLVSQRVSALIRGHGIALWLRGVPLQPRPERVPEADVRDPQRSRPSRRASRGREDS
jgi:DUF1365 family protein